VKDWTTPALVVLILIAGFVAVRSISANAELRAAAEVAQAEAEAFEAVVDSALAVVDSMAAETKRLEAETARIRTESDQAIASLRGRMTVLARERALGSGELRLALPDSLQALFDEHELIHAAELSAAELVIEQKDRQLKASDALNATLRTQITGLIEALDVQIKRGDKWELSSMKWEAAASPGFFANLLGDVPKYLIGAGVGAILVSR